MAHFDPASIKALTFDVFGTVVDWRSSITREGQEFGKAHGFNNVDWVNFAERVARNVSAGHGRGAERPAAVGQARRPAS
jgi:FMN phosphatase YigB (HAD superfamily)